MSEIIHTVSKCKNDLMSDEFVYSFVYKDLKIVFLISVGYINMLYVQDTYIWIK